jgi:hypothetical protein
MEDQASQSHGRESGDGAKSDLRARNRTVSFSWPTERKAGSKEREKAVIFRPPKWKVNEEDVCLVSRENLLLLFLSVNKRLPWPAQGEPILSVYAEKFKHIFMTYHQYAEKKQYEGT